MVSRTLAHTLAATRRWLSLGLVLNLALVSATRAQSVVAGYELQPWATVSDPVDLSVAPDGAIFVGRDAAGSGGTSADAVELQRIAPDGSVATYGPPIPDPDTVLVDPLGQVATPGAVITGGISAPPTTGQLVAVDTQQNLTVLFGPTTSLVNPSGLALEASGDLLVTDFNERKVFRFSNLVPTEIISSLTSNPLDVAVAPGSGTLAISWSDGVIRTYAPGGAPLADPFAPGRALAYHPTSGDLWTVDNTTGQLLRIAPNGTTSVIGSGFTSVWGLDFDATGDLYLGEFTNDRVLRVRPQPWTDLGNALAGTHGDPLLVGSGTLLGGDPFAVTLSNALAGAGAWFVLGFAELSAPFKGGVLVPDPAPPALLAPLPVGPTGGVALAASWPPGVPSGVATWYQWWIQDPAGPLGFAASNGLRGVTP